MPLGRLPLRTDADERLEKFDGAGGVDGVAIRTDLVRKHLIDRRSSDAEFDMRQSLFLEGVDHFLHVDRNQPSVLFTGEDILASVYVVAVGMQLSVA